jgi:hypothetical protein
VRFLLGGAVVSAFAAAGQLFKPKTFSGLFGAAPSVAIATLALAFSQHDAKYIATEARSMLIGSLAILVYCITLVVLTKRVHVPVWISAAAAWLVWFAVAFALFAVARVGGIV